MDYHVFPSFLLSVDLDCIHNQLQINQPKIAIPKIQFMTLALQGTSLKNTDAYNILKIKHHHQQTDDYYEFIAVQWDTSRIKRKASSFLKFRCLFTSTFEVHTPYIQHQQSITHHTERKIQKLSHTKKTFHPNPKLQHGGHKPQNFNHGFKQDAWWPCQGLGDCKTLP